MRWITFLFLVACSFQFCLNAQSIDWFIEPVIDDADEIQVNPYERELIVFKKDSKYGVKNIDNEVIVPPNHSFLKISIDQKFIYLGDISRYKPPPGSLYVLSSETGDSISMTHDEVLKCALEHPWKNKFDYHTYDAVKAFTKQHDLVFQKKQNPNYSNTYKIFDKKNKLIIDSIDQRVYYLKEGYIVVYRKKKAIVFNKSGQIVFKTKKCHSFTSTGKGLFLFNAKVLNQDWEVVEEGLYRRNEIKLIDGYNLYLVEKNLKTYLKDIEGNLVLQDGFQTIKQFNQDWLILDGKEKDKIYSLKKHKVTYSINGNINYINPGPEAQEGNVTIRVPADHTIKLSKYKHGVYNYLKDILVVDTVYDHTSISRNNITARQLSETSKILKDYTVFDYEGKERFKIKAVFVSEANGNTFFIRSGNDYNSLVDSTGKTLMMSTEKHVLMTCSRYWLFKYDIRRNSVFYLIDDLVRGVENEYDHVSRFHNKTVPQDEYFIYAKNNRYGLMTPKEGVILQPEFDFLGFQGTVNSNKLKHLIMVKKNEKWGAFWHPFYESRYYENRLSSQD